MQRHLTWGPALIMPSRHRRDDRGLCGLAQPPASSTMMREIAVVTAGVPAGIAGTTNMIKVIWWAAASSAVPGFRG